MRASFCSPCPARLGFSLFFPVFSLPTGHHSSFSSPVPRPPRISSLLPCFFSDRGASLPFFFSCAPPGSDFLSSSLFFLWRRGTTALFLLPCPAQNNFSLFFPAFSLAAGHHRLLFALHAPPRTTFLSSSLFFLWRRGTTGFFLLSMPRPARIFSLLPCFFSAGGAPQLFFFSHAPPGRSARSPILTKTATSKPFC